MHTRAPDQPRRGRASRRVKAAVVLTTLTLLAACGSSKSSTDAGGGGATTAAASGGSTAGGGAAAPTGEVKVGMAKGDIDTLDPNRWYFAATWGLANALCSTLVRYDDKPGADGVKVVAGLADMPTVSADGLQYDFKLKDSKFANGQAITPDDIKYTFERLMAPDVDTGTGGYFFALAGQDDYASGKATEISGITTTADTVTFKLTAPDGSFLNKIALPTTCPVGKDAAYKPDEAVDILKENASGPYTIDSYTPEQSMTWVRNPGYNAAALGDRGKAEKISFEIGVDPSQAAPKIKAGDIDVYTGNFPTADITTLSNDASLKDR